MQLIPRVLVSGGLLLALVAGATLDVAAQGAGPCPYASDAILGQALGPGAHGQVVPNGTGAICLVAGVSDTPLILTHVANAFPDGTPVPADQLAQVAPTGVVQGPNGSAQLMPIDGLGDSATLLIGSRADGTSGAVLTVQRGTDLYTFVMASPPANAQDLLTGLAQAVLAAAP